VCNKAQPATAAAAASLNPLVRGRRGAAILRSAPLRRPSRPLSIMVREEGTEGRRAPPKNSNWLKFSSSSAFYFGRPHHSSSSSSAVVVVVLCNRSACT
jgi:hypothetical protein